jgi:hypothetical protein
MSEVERSEVERSDLERSDQERSDQERSDQERSDLMRRIDELDAEMARLRARVEAIPGESPVAPAPPAPPAHDAAAEPVSRRRALRTVGTVAAGALAGGFALGAGADPAAAAAPASFDATTGVPAVTADAGAAAATDAIHASAAAAGRHGLYAVATGTTSAYGVYGFSTADSSSIGVRGRSTSGSGVSGDTTSGTGVIGTSTSGRGVSGASDSNAGVHGSSTNGAGVAGTSYNAPGVSGSSTNGVGGDFSGDTAGHLHGTAIGLRASGGRVAASFDNTNAAPPTRTSVRFNRGDLDVDANGNLWFCIGSGTPGIWRQITGPGSAGSFHAVTPGRVYDSRCAQPSPGRISVGTKRTLSVADQRNLETGIVTVPNFVPAGATAVSANITVVETSGNGWLAVNPGGTLAVTASTINWSASGLYLANCVNLTLNTNRQITVICGNGSTDFFIDINGYYL